MLSVRSAFCMIFLLMKLVAKSSSTNNTWKATSTIYTIDSIFDRTFKLYSVNRDSNGRVVLNGGTLDSNTRELTVSVSWRLKGATTTKVLSTYITNIQ